MAVAARGTTYFKLSQCAFFLCDKGCLDIDHTSDAPDCQENLTVYASDCSQLEIAEVYPGQTVPPIKFCPLADGH